MYPPESYRVKKSMGQHFLHDLAIADTTVDALDLTSTADRIIEIGPGPGVLTERLLMKDIQLKCIELDRDMVSLLTQKFKLNSEQLIQSDILKVDFNTLFQGESFNVIGNFPYNISSQIVFKIIDNKQLVPEMVGMFQKEMAERIIAPPGSKTYGVISVLTQAWYDGTKVVDVPPSAFNPPPKVQSLVIKLTRKENPTEIPDPKAFTTLVKQSFSMRRKMLRNNLKPLFQDKSVLEDSFFDKRPEQLSLEQFIDLTHLYITHKNKHQ